MATSDVLLNRLVTAQAQSNALANYNYVVGQTIDAARRQAEAEAFQQIIAARDQRTYVSTLYRDLLDSSVRIYSAMSGQDVARRAAQTATGEMTGVIRAIGQNYSRLIRSRRGAFAEANARVGREANRAALAAFERGRKGGSAYRSGEGNLRYKRFAGGQMSAALASDNMFLARPDGLAWINAAWLDIQAPQWYRLNFGAGIAGSSSPPSRPYQVSFFQQPVGVIGLVGFQTSPSFFLPAGFFTTNGNLSGAVAAGSGRGQAFRPLSYKTSSIVDEAKSGGRDKQSLVRRAPVLSRGIRGTNYLDAGMAVIAKAWPLEQTRLIRNILTESVQSGGTTTEFSISGIDLKDQRKFAAQVTKEMDTLVSRALSARGPGSVGRSFLSGF